MNIKEDANLEILSLIYDKIEKVSEDRYFVDYDNKQKIIDGNNNTIKEINGKNVISGIGSEIYIGCYGSGYDVYDPVTFKKIRSTLYSSIRQLDANAWVVQSDKLVFEGCGLINSKGEEILQCIYKYIYLYSKKSTLNYIKAKLHTELSPWKSELYKIDSETDNMSYIICNSDYTSVDCYGAIETGIDGVQIALTSIGFKPYYRGLNCKYRIRNFGKLVGKEYDDLLPRRGLYNLGIIQSYTKHSEDKITTGYVAINGDEIVRSNIYSDVSYIGNGITIVKNRSGYGTVKNGTEVVTPGIIQYHYMAANIPITIAVVQSNQFYVGNDGNLYSSITEAFPIYKSLVDQTIYLICLYGTWLYVDKGLNIINKYDTRLNQNVRDNRQWIKV